MTIRIHHVQGANQGRSQSFEGDVVRFGRRDECEVRFHPTTDAAASGLHAEIRRENGAWVFVDLGSSNGSYLGGQPISRLGLAGGELIEIGRGGPVIRVDLGSMAPRPRTEIQPAAGASSERRPVGSRTIGVMIQAALEQSRNRRTGKVPTAAFIRAVAGEAVRNGSRTFKIVVLVAVVLLCGAVAFLVIELRRTRSEMDELALSKLGPAEIGEWIGANYGPAIYLLLYRTGLGFEQGFCTAFAVAADRLLTNAHCIAQMERLSGEGSTFFAAQNGMAGSRLPVRSWKAHPRYDVKATRPTADAGVVWVGGTLPVAVNLAAAAQAAGLRPGSQIWVFGFPGDLSNVGSPVATLTEGVVGRLTTLDGQAGMPLDRHLLQYSAFTSKGTSGSPVFDKTGRVVAVNSGYYQGKSRVRIENPLTGEGEDANVSRDLSGYSFGVRIDLAGEVLR
jgi:V8-like Glu-specific endopeptidase